MGERDGEGGELFKASSRNRSSSEKKSSFGFFTTADFMQ